MLPEVSRPYNLQDWVALTQDERVDLEDRVVAAYAISGSTRKVAREMRGALTHKHIQKIISRRVPVTDTTFLPNMAEVHLRNEAYIEEAEEIGVNGWTPEASQYFHTVREHLKITQRIAEVGGESQTEIWVLDDDLG